MREYHRRDADRNVDPKDPPPRDVRDDDAAENDAEDRSGVEANRVEAVCTAALIFGEVVRDHCARVGREECATDSLGEPWVREVSMEAPRGESPFTLI